MEPNFDRPYYQDTGRRPFLFYAAIGAKAEELHVSRSKHRVEEMPEGLGLSGLQRPGHSGHMDELLGGPLGKILNERDPELYERAKAAQSWLVVYGEVREDSTLDYLRNAVGFVATGGTCTVYPQLAGDLEDPDYNNEHYSLRWEDCEFESE